MTWNPIGPTPRPKPDARNPSPAPRPRAAWPIGRLLPWILLAAMAGYLYYDRQTRPDAGPGATKAAGQAYGRALAQTYADGLDAYLAAIAAGTAESEAQAALQARWTAARIERHRETVQPVLNAIRPAGSEWTDDDQKQRYRAAIEGIQAGLRAVK